MADRQVSGSPMRISVRELIGDLRSLTSEYGSFLVIVAAGIAAGYSAIDLVSESMNFVASIVVTLFVQVLVTEKLLSDRIGGDGIGHRKYGSLFLASLLAGLAIVVGTILLIVPGLILFAAWSALTPFIVVEGRSGTAAMEASWEATRGSRMAIALVTTVALLIFLVATVGVIGGLYGLTGDSAISDEPSLAQIVATNVLVGAYTVASWVLGASVYRLLVPDSRHFDEVFG